MAPRRGGKNCWPTPAYDPSHLLISWEQQHNISDFSPMSTMPASIISGTFPVNGFSCRMIQFPVGIESAASRIFTATWNSYYGGAGQSISFSPAIFSDNADIVNPVLLSFGYRTITHGSSLDLALTWVDFQMTPQGVDINTRFVGGLPSFMYIANGSIVEIAFKRRVDLNAGNIYMHSVYSTGYKYPT